MEHGLGTIEYLPKYGYISGWSRVDLQPWKALDSHPRIQAYNFGNGNKRRGEPHRTDGAAISNVII